MAKAAKWGSTYKVLLDVGFLTDSFVLGGYATTQTRTNQVRNPNFETGTTGWVRSSANSDIFAYTLDSYIGTASMRLYMNVNGGVTAAGVDFANNATYRIPCVQGQTFTASAYLKNLSGTRNWRITIITFATATGTAAVENYTTATAITNPTDWTIASATYTLTDPTSLFLEMRITPATTGAIGNEVLIDACLVELSSSALPYFDGYFSEAYTGYELTSQSWTGTADASSSTATFGLVSSLFGSTLDGTDVLDGSTDFVDVTEYVTNININRGRATQLDSFPSSNCTITADDRAAARYFDPLNTASEWYSGGTVGIAPRRKFEVYGGTAGTTSMFTGFVYDLNIDYAEPNLSTATIVATDALGQLGQTVLTAFNPSSQLTSDRVSAILDRPEVAFSTALRNIETGLATCGTVAYEDATNALTALQDVATAEGGRLFVSRSGLVEFDARIESSFGTAVASFGGTAGLPIQSLSNIYGAETVLNRVAVQIDGGTASSIANGTASQAEYGIKALSLTGVPLADDAAGSALALSLLTRFQEPVVRFSEMDVLLNALSTAQQAQMAALEIGDILEVTKTFSTGTPATVTQNVVVESIRHSINPSTHRVNIGLGQVQLVIPFILDTSELDDPVYALQ